MEENKDAARIYMKVRRQTLNYWNGERDIPVDLNHLAVWAMIDAYEIKNRLDTFEKVIRTFHAIQENSGD